MLILCKLAFVLKCLLPIYKSQ